MPRTKCRLASAKSKDDMPPGSAPSIFQVRGAEKKRAVEFSMRVIAFHEKAGRSQVGCSWFLLVMVFFSPAELATVAILPSALS